MAEINKVRLDIDQLSVDSFGTGAADEMRGTVRGHDDITSGPSCRNTCTVCDLTDAC